MSSPALQHFETFLMVAKTGSFTAAAKELRVTKAAVSHAVRLLEESLQVPLFIRSTRRVNLTDEGELLLTQCQRLQHELDVARDLVGSFQRKPSGKLRISCNQYLAQSRLLKPLQQYQQLFPQVEIDILVEERMPNMQQEQIDIVFGVNWPAPEDVVARPIGKTRYVLCASPTYLKKYGTPKKINDLSEHHYIAHSGRSPDNMIVNLKHEINLNLNTPLKLNNAMLMKQCALMSMGIIQLHDYMLADELQSGKLIVILSDYLKPDIPLYVYYQKHRFVQPKIRQFIKLILPE
jgi:DNA-binding transcriptional LysR family regulator